MEKKTYYVSVQAKTVMENQGDGAYELDIEATPEEVRQLRELFESTSEADFMNYVRVHNPELLEEEVISNELVDRHLTEIYRLLEKLGTPETKAHIRSMNVLEGMQHGYTKQF